MSTLDEYINDLEDLEANLDDIISKAIYSKEGMIVGLIKNRLYQRGLDGDNKLIGNYAASTEAVKRAEGKRASFITLRDEGLFYNGMFVDYANYIFNVRSSDGKTPSLIQKYGESILELTEQEQELLIYTIIEPAIIKHINDLGQIISLGDVSNIFSAQ
jgi:hypothetical protein